MGFDPFNKKAKEQAKVALEAAYNNHKKQSENLTKQFVVLQENRQRLANKLKDAERGINRFKNTPAHFQKSVQILSANLHNYGTLLEAAKQESANISRGAGVGTMAGVAAGGTVAAFGGTALTAVAMSLGTASTGTAIGALSGAAATNAALAWLGGGAVAAGGAGIAGGEALLALTGPIGWGIGGIIVAGTGIWARGKNAEAAADMRSNAVKIHASVDAIKALIQEVKSQRELTIKVTDGLKSGITMMNNLPNDFNQFTENQLNQIGAFVDSTLAAEKILNAKLGKNNKFNNPKSLDTNHESKAVSKKVANIKVYDGRKIRFKGKPKLTSDGVVFETIQILGDENTYKNVRVKSKGTLPDYGNVEFTGTVWVFDKGPIIMDVMPHYM